MCYKYNTCVVVCVVNCVCVCVINIWDAKGFCKRTLVAYMSIATTTHMHVLLIIWPQESIYVAITTNTCLQYIYLLALLCPFFIKALFYVQKKKGIRVGVIMQRNDGWNEFCKHLHFNRKENINNYQHN